jgi:cytoskeleton protein RodZ
MADSEQPGVATPTPTPTNLGQVLRDARVAQDLTIDQLATELRIEARQLVALEDNRFEQIGVPVFVKGYLRQYAQRLGVDQQSLLALYGQQARPPEVQIQPSRTIKLRDERQITVWVVALLLLALIAVSLGVWWFNGGLDIAATTRRVLGGDSSLAPSSTPVAPAPAPAEAPATPPPSATPQSTAKADTARPATAVEPEPVAVAAAQQPTDSDSDVTVAPSEDGDLPLAAIPLDLTFDAESWTEITDGRGERLFFGLAAAGRRMTLRGEPPFAVVFGNAEAVRLTVDGKPYPIPQRGRQDGRVRFSIASDEE